MKKYFSLMAGIILLLFAACQNDELVNGDGKEVSVSFDVQIPDDGAVTRAETKTNGDGTTVNRCILEIYQGDQLYGTRHVAAMSGKTVTFSDIRLVTSQTYQFVFWADHVADASSAITSDLHYTTTSADGLKNITFTSGYTGNDETRDAFFCTMEKTVTAAFTENIKLTRPFGQLNIKTTDWADIPTTKSELKPAKASLTFKTDLYTTFNALSGDASGAQKLSYQAPVSVVNAQDGTLTLDYILAPSTGQLPLDITLTTYKEDGSTSITSKDLTSIPVQRNYKTNVSGKLLTVSGEVNVEVKPAFNKDNIEIKVKEVATVSEVAAALAECDNVVVTEAPTTETTISLPKSSAADRELSITLPTTDKQITIQYDTNSSSGSNVPKVLNITIPNANAALVIEAAETTVYLNGTKYASVTAGTAPNTLVIGAGVEVTSLTVNAGNVKVIGNGKIGSISKGSSYQGTAYIIASDQATLPTDLSGFTVIASEEAIAIKEALAKGEAYMLKEDADITNASVVVPVNKVATLDLNGYTITAANSSPISGNPGIGSITVQGKLTLKDSKGNGKIIGSKDYNSATDGNGVVVVDGENAFLEMLSGTIYAVRNNAAANGQYGIIVSDGGDFTMKGGRIEVGWCAVGGNGIDKTKNSVIKIEGGELVSTSDYVLYLPHAGETAISGGTIVGAAGGVCIQRGILNISGTADICSLGTGDTGDWSDGTGGKVNTALMVSAKYGDCTVNISGGKLTAAKDLIFLKEKSNFQQNVTVTGGTFSDASLLGYLGANANVKVKMTADKSCGGFVTKSGQVVDIDLNQHTLTLVEPRVGSAGSETNSCQLLKGSKVTFSNGKLQSTNADGIMIQNYSDLLLKDVEVEDVKAQYVVSNNYGSCTVTNSTITSGTSFTFYAMDVYSASSPSYAEGVTVTINGGSVINGKVIFAGDTETPISKLIVNGGTFNGHLRNYDYENFANIKDYIIINGGEFGKYTGWSDYK